MAWGPHLKENATMVDTAPRRELSERDKQRAAIATYGDTIHSLIERDYQGPFIPGFQERIVKGKGVGLRVVDHIVGNVELGRMDEWVAFYANVMGFEQLVHFSDEQISTEYS